MKIKKEYLLVLILLIALLIRVAFSVYAQRQDFEESFSDDLAYMDLAEQMLDQSLMVRDIHSFEHPAARVVGPGVSLWVALSIIIFGKNWLALFILNSIIGTILCYFIYKLGKRVFNDRIALLAAAWSAFYVLYINYTPTAGKEIWMSLLFTLSLLSLILLIENINAGKSGKGVIVVLIISFGFLIHVDERYFSYFPLFILAIFLMMNHKKSALKYIAAFIIGVLIIMIPWLVRNHLVFDRIVVLSVRTAPMTDNIFGYDTPTDTITSELDKVWYLSEAQIDSVIRGEKSTMGVYHKKVPDKQIRAMRDGILPHQFSTLESYANVFLILWKPVDLSRSYSTTGYRYDGKWSLAHNLTVGITYGLLLPFAIIGFIALFKHRRKIFWLFLSILIWHSLIHMLAIPFTRNRYHIPVDAILIITGVAGMYLLWTILRGKNKNLRQAFEELKI